MKHTGPDILLHSHASVVEFRHTIRDNTYRSFAITVALIFTAALLLTFVTVSPTVIDPGSIAHIDYTFVNLPPMVTSDAGSSHAPAESINGLMFVKHVQTSVVEPTPPEKNQQVNDPGPSSQQPGTVIGSTQNLGVSNNGDSKPNTQSLNAQDPDIDNINFADIEPKVDLQTLQSKLEYPEFMRRTGTNGEVLLSVLVGEDGHIVTYKVLRSSNDSFTDAAVKAIMKTPLTPGYTNNQAVRCWVSIPITFKIR